MPWSYIAGTGSAVPEKVLTNEDLEKMVDTSDEWIRTRSGIERRHIAEEDETTATLGAEAAQKALEDAGVSPEEVDFIIVATVTPEMLFPSTACVIQDMIGAKKAGAMDLSAGCSGFIYALSVADSFVRIGQSETVLVVASETLSKITDWTDRSTCVLFGDGAGAAVIMPSPDGERGIINTILGSDGSKGELLYMPAGGSRYPASHETVDKRMHYIKMNGREVFKIAVEAMGEAAASVVEGAGYRPEDVDLLIPHQANIRIIKATAKRLGISMDRVYVNIQEYGNTSAASIPIAVDEAKRKGFLRPGDLVVAVAFGAGLTWASTLFRF
ncbi:MAG: 3-oxoacyl-ACP synthase [Candidatus Latescibacterota bacterium]|mgnify:CR=1 FL=1|nr:MAG: 3-oxoacyl-ACP synthase [Candidatus Latescibacterota bacterium]